jgi:putative hydrolase of the HAD superfamily
MPLPFKHYSFDLWLTLIRSNPDFKSKRSDYFHERFNTKGKPLEDVAACFRRIDLMCNAVNERSGKNIDADEMYLMVIDQINHGALPLDTVDIDELMDDMEALLFQNLPRLYCDQTAKVLDSICSDDNCSISLLSNTGFIPGRVMRKVLHELGIGERFGFQMYSDEVGLSKPNEAFFRLLLETLRTHRHCSPEEILHVGDNPKADLFGAKQAGIQGLLIHSNQVPITHVLQHAPANLLPA